MFSATLALPTLEVCFKKAQNMTLEFCLQQEVHKFALPVLLLKISPKTA
jgi:hypothetical protein